MAEWFERKWENVAIDVCMAKGDIKKIFTDNWDKFLILHGMNVRKVVVDEVKKMLECGVYDNTDICIKAQRIRRWQRKRKTDQEK